MTPARAGALALGAACILIAADANAQNAAALAKAAARSADAFDTLVTPGARRALERITDNEKVDPAAEAPARKTAAPPRTTSVSGRTEPETRTPDATEQKPADETVSAADSATTINDITARRIDDAVELRIVAPGQHVPALSEPFRAGEHSRLFITFEHAKLALAAPPVLAEAGSMFAGVDIAERDGGVRIALDIASLGAYEMQMSGDTAVLRLAVPPPAQTEATTQAPAAADLDDIALAREAALAGWSAFRSDVGSVASAVGGFVVRTAAATGRATGAAWHTMTHSSANAAQWIADTIPFGSIARAVVLLALLGAPPIVALRMLRRRQTAVRAPAGIVGLEAHTRAPAAARMVEKQPKPVIEKRAKVEKPAKPPKSDRKARKPAVTRTTADARLWAARTLADNGADVGEIARQTGLSREAAILLVRRASTR